MAILCYCFEYKRTVQRKYDFSFVFLRYVFDPFNYRETPSGWFSTLILYDFSVLPMNNMDQTICQHGKTATNCKSHGKIGICRIIFELYLSVLGDVSQRWEYHDTPIDPAYRATSFIPLKHYLWSLTKYVLTRILHKLIKCQLLPKLTIWFVRFRPLTAFNRQDTTVDCLASTFFFSIQIKDPLQIRILLFSIFPFLFTSY